MSSQLESEFTQSRTASEVESRSNIVSQLQSQPQNNNLSEGDTPSVSTQ